METKVIISEEYFEALKTYAEAFNQFFSKLISDTSFKTFFATLNKWDENTSQKDFEIEIYGLLFWQDLSACLALTSNDSDRKKDVESFSFLVLFNPEYQKLSYSSLMLLDDDAWLSYKDNLIFTKEDWVEQPTPSIDTLLQLPDILGKYDKDLEEEYLINLYRFVSVIIKADGKVTKQEEDVLKNIMRLTEKNKNYNGAEKIVKTKEGVHLPLNQALNELNSLIGLNAVKQEITSLVNFIRIQKARENTGLKASSVSYHIVFTGNPGTGKTTIARIVAQIYRDLGVLQKGHMVETDRSGLVAEYVGQTAVKVNKLIDSALDGVLFIDEAYSIVGENQDDFGKEAVATLIKRMEDNRDRLVVILAGYTNEMNRFIGSNPGFKSRFNRYIEFADYKPSELLSIYESYCSRLDYRLMEEARIKLTGLFDKAYQLRDKSFGNGRFARNVFEKTIEWQANRLAGVSLLNNDILTTIEADDIPSI